VGGFDTIDPLHLGVAHVLLWIGVYAPGAGWPRGISFRVMGGFSFEKNNNFRASPGCSSARATLSRGGIGGGWCGKRTSFDAKRHRGLFWWPIKKNNCS